MEGSGDEVSNVSMGETMHIAILRNYVFNWICAHLLRMQTQLIRLQTPHCRESEIISPCVLLKYLPY